MVFQNDKLVQIHPFQLRPALGSDLDAQYLAQVHHRLLRSLLRPAVPPVLLTLPISLPQIG